MTVTGTPELTLRVGLDHKAAKYKSGSPGTALVFQYDVKGGVNDTDGVSVPSGKIKLGTDGAIDATNEGGAAWLSTAGRGLRDQAEHKVDTAPEMADAETTTDGERIVVDVLRTNRRENRAHRGLHAERRRDRGHPERGQFQHPERSVSAHIAGRHVGAGAEPGIRPERETGSRTSPATTWRISRRR